MNFLYEQVIEWIPKGSRVLDLGTGDGEFLAKLIKAKDVIGEGVEKDPEMMARCIEKGLIVHQGDVLDGLDQYPDTAFDFVLLMGTFQELSLPDLVLKEAFRVGKQVIISYTNFSYWPIRLQLMFYGRSPVTRAMPYQWYNTPTEHFFSIFDFDDFCEFMKMKELKSAYFCKNRRVSLWPNLRAEYSLSLLESADD